MIVVLLILMSTGCRAPVPAADKVGSFPADRWNFTDDAIGRVPTTVTIVTGDWAVRLQNDGRSTRNALCETSSGGQHLALLGTSTYGDVIVTARIKPITGAPDQSIGLLIRMQATGAGYVLHANPRQDIVAIAKRDSDQLTELAANAVNVPSSDWQELRAHIQGPLLRGYLNGRLVVEATDTTYPIGRIDLWTQAATAACFADVEAKPVTAN